MIHHGPLRLVGAAERPNWRTGALSGTGLTEPERRLLDPEIVMVSP